MKSLKSSHREKRRYLLIKGENADKKSIDEVILEFIGILGYAEACPLFVKSNKKGIILSINRKSLNKIRASFLMSGKDLGIVRVCGSIKKLK